jgi:hypothetical protein
VKNKTRRGLRAFYRVVENGNEYAGIETRGGWYFCEVSRCSDESRKDFRARVRSLIEAVEAYRYPMTLANPEAT